MTDTASETRKQSNEAEDDSAEKIVEDLIAQTPKIAGGYDDPKIMARIRRFAKKKREKASEKS